MVSNSNYNKNKDLDEETKDKLKLLIHSHMSKLLVKIPEVKGDEDVHSINSEQSKSSTANYIHNMEVVTNTEANLIHSNSNEQITNEQITSEELTSNRETD